MPLNLYFQNIRGASQKASLIKRNMMAMFFDIVLLVETWIQEGFFNSELIPVDDYQVFRRDRNLFMTKKKDGWWHIDCNS